MKTFPVTIETLKWSHLIRALGFILGLVSIVVMSYIILLTGIEDYMKSGGLSAVAYTSVIILFGLLLLIPNRFLNKTRVTKYTYLALGSAYILRCICATITTYKETEMTTTCITATVIFGVVSTVLANMKIFLSNGEPIAMEQ